MAKIDWKAMEANHVRFEADLDQLKAKMLEAIASHDEDWLFDLEETLLVWVKDGHYPLADIARFAKIGMAAVLESYDPTDDEGNPIIYQ